MPGHVGQLEAARDALTGVGTLDLKTLFQCHYAATWRLLRRLGVSLLDLDDAAQEVFWVAARRLDDIEAGRERSFLYGVALRVASGHLRRKSPALALESEGPSRLVDQGPSPEQVLEQRQARQLLDRVIGAMPMELRTVFVLHELEGLQVAQIADIEGIPVGTASSRLRRAREEFSASAKRVRATLGPRGGHR